MTVPLLEVVDLVKVYRLARPGWFAPHATRRAVDGVSLTIHPGRSFGVVGESGSGKSTLARAVMALEQPTAGMVRLDGHSLFDLSPRALRAARAEMQMIFQDPYGSLDPRQRVGRIVAEPLINLAHVTRVQRAARVLESLRAVGLIATDADKYPHEFSGGQRQRIAIARALVTRPKLVVADEPVSALDVSIQAQVLNLMSDLQREAGVTFFLISHDLAVVGHLCDDVAVMFRGRFVETGPAAALFSAPEHPYTRELIDAAPKLEEAPIVAVERAAATTRRRAAAPMRRAAASRRRAAAKRRRRCARSATAAPSPAISRFSGFRRRAVDPRIERHRAPSCARSASSRSAWPRTAATASAPSCRRSGGVSASSASATARAALSGIALLRPVHAARELRARRRRRRGRRRSSAYGAARRRRIWCGRRPARRS